MKTVLEISYEIRNLRTIQMSGALTLISYEIWVDDKFWSTESFIDGTPDNDPGDGGKELPLAA